MQLVSHHEVPSDRDEVTTLRPSPLGPLLVGLLFVGFTLALCGFLFISASRVPLWLGVLAAPPAAFVLVLLLVVDAALLRAFRASLLPSCWTLRCDRAGVWLPIRSWMNPEFEPAPATAVRIPYGDLQAARRVVRRSDVGDGLRFTSHLELELAPDIDLEPVRAAIREENGRSGPEGRFLGIRSRSRAVHAPLRVAGPHRLQADWPGRRALRELRDQGVRVQETRRDVEEAIEPGREAKGRILAHVESGETILAVKLARETYGMGLAEAKAFVEDLSEREQDAA